ncbi:hypothetical protein M662_12815 [Bacillus sp. SB49]|uniref:hypothetical protein n=1 Tax=Bacillus sp. SB49 TaxID=1071080 RepID=UPI000421231C|nr:hypothetical protein [Bacillus sp. SB49]QHT47331.1 hypothetical protein M662_12815 [Bacillus sp. SB49]
MKKKKKLQDSDWKLSIMALGIFLGVSISGQLTSLSDLPNLPSIYGALTGSLLLVIANLIYVLYKKYKTVNNKKKNDIYE